MSARRKKFNKFGVAPPGEEQSVHPSPDDDSDDSVSDYSDEEGSWKDIEEVEMDSGDDSADDDVQESSSGTRDSREVASDAMSSLGTQGHFRNRERVLVFCSRGISNRFRHLVLDLRALLPHSKKEAKLDRRENLFAINEVCELRNCSSCLYFECRRGEQLYLWAAKTPSGPSVKFEVLNVHTMEELRMTGNCLKGSRPILSFDASFDSAPHWKLVKELFSQIFTTPKGHHNSKPFIDHVMSFFIVDGKIWMRNYQIIDLTKKAERKLEDSDTQLVEIGPRLTLDPIRIFSEGFSGATLYSNPAYVTPQVKRATERKAKSTAFLERKSAVRRREIHKRDVRMELDPVDDVFRRT